MIATISSFFKFERKFDEIKKLGSNTNNAQTIFTTFSDAVPVCIVYTKWGFIFLTSQVAFYSVFCCVCCSLAIEFFELRSSRLNSNVNWSPTEVCTWCKREGQFSTQRCIKSYGPRTVIRPKWNYPLWPIKVIN